jgi:pimeloyl-ACP methyl ester carboxylesterase
VTRLARRLPLALAAVVALCAPAAASGAATKFERLPGFKAPGTPAKYNEVGVLEIGPPSAKNVLVLNPGTSASAAYFAPLARTIVARAKGWQVWSVERRENLLEDHSMLNRVKAGNAGGKALFDYYLGHTTDTSVTNHFEFIPDGKVRFARKWGMRVEIEDLRRVVQRARRNGRRVVVGGHSLGGTITAAYATWDFGGKPGAKGLAGLVFIDGGSSPTPNLTEAQARQALKDLAKASPWLTFGGITAPFAGLFNVVGSGLTKIEPNAPSRLESWIGTPSDLKPPVPATNVGGYGYALDTETSPPGLIAAQAHLGRLAASGSPRRWDNAGELTPIQRYATIFSGWGLRGLDGTAWYHPRRLTIDGGAVAGGNANPAQKVLSVRSTHGRGLPKSLRLYAFGAALGGQRVLDAATALAKQSGIPASQVKLVDRHATYAHNDPNSAAPKNDFVRFLVPFLAKVARK